MKHEQANGGPNAHAGMCGSEKGCRINSSGEFNATSEAKSGGTSKRFLSTEEPIKTYPKATVPGGSK